MGTHSMTVMVACTGGRLTVTNSDFVGTAIVSRRLVLRNSSLIGRFILPILEVRHTGVIDSCYFNGKQALLFNSVALNPFYDFDVSFLTITNSR